MITDNDIVFDNLYDEFKDFMDNADEVVSIKHYMEDNGIAKETMFVIYETYIYELKRKNEAKNA
jgi:hypothetical protein|tara:strand:- start:798 stop:989 length:192 start_codon:yes stop_codon:yes gene_type:complete